MSVLLEFTLDAEEFRLGDVLSTAAPLDFELERIVPTGNFTMPFVWAATDDDPDTVLSDFEYNMRNNPRVHELLLLDRVDDGGLYRIEWESKGEELIEALGATEATVLEAWGDGTWTFRVRFNDHERLTEFHNYLTDREITIHIERTYTFSRESARRRDFGLTADQREALVLALDQGYFSNPKDADLEDLAEELELSQQAVSDRIRRGNEKILRMVLLSYTSG